MVKLLQLLPGRTTVLISKSMARLAPNYFNRKLHYPVFFVGCGRSGTTILSQALALHPDIAVYPGEANELWHPHLYPWVKATINAPVFWDDPVTFTSVSLNQPKRSQYDQYLQAVFGAYQYLDGGRVFLNKSVMVTFMMPHILGLFPEAKFIHLVRDGRSAALSYAVKERKKIQQSLAVYREKGYELNFHQLLDRFVCHWQEHIFEVERQKSALNLTETQLLELSYEKLCAGFDDEMKRLCDFMGVAFSALPRSQVAEFRDMNHKVAERLSEAQVERMTQLAGAALKQKGYIEGVQLGSSTT